MTAPRPSRAPRRQSAGVSASTPQPSADRRERRHVEIREKLFRAALRLFTEKGFAEVTVEEITNAADVGKGTFFNYFPSKDHILAAFGDMQLGKLRSAVEEARHSSEPMPDFMRRLARVMTAEPGRNPAIIRTVLMGHLSSEPVRGAIREKIERGRELLTQLIALGQERGEVRRDLEPMELARAMHQAAFGTLLMWSVSPDVPLLNRMESVFNLLWSGMQALQNTRAGGARPVKP
jgi:AcrR family transcriptional regulator